MNIEAFEERAAIMEFDGGMTRFQAETLAAEAQGLKRWEAINEIRKSNSRRGGDNRQSVGGRQRANAMPGVQQRTAQEGRSVSERDQEAGRDRLALLAL